MACPVCGKSSPCAHEQPSATVLVGPAAYDSLEHGLGRSVSSRAKVQQPGQAWREEVVSRVQQHRARRRKRYDPDASMELNFSAGLDSSALTLGETEAVRPRSTTKSELPKIIEFPKPAAPAFFHRDRTQEPEDLELAGPVLDAPRILDAPEHPAEQMDLLPAFADIQLEAEESRSEGVELPPQPAPLSYRIFAGLVDMIVVLMASGGFVMAFLSFAKGLPQPRLILLYILMVCGSLWLIYQYLFLVYASGTPGMQLAQLELCTFRGEPVSLPVRRWRALASALSALALGLGFAWAFVDEDTLGWHDRMTQTHMRKQSGAG